MSEANRQSKPFDFFLAPARENPERLGELFQDYVECLRGGKPLSPAYSAFLADALDHVSQSLKGITRQSLEDDQQRAKKDIGDAFLEAFGFKKDGEPKRSALLNHSFASEVSTLVMLGEVKKDAIPLVARKNKIGGSTLGRYIKGFATESNSIDKAESRVQIAREVRYLLDLPLQKEDAVSVVALEHAPLSRTVINSILENVRAHVLAEAAQEELARGLGRTSACTRVANRNGVRIGTVDKALEEREHYEELFELNSALAEELEKGNADDPVRAVATKHHCRQKQVEKARNPPKKAKIYYYTKYFLSGARIEDDTEERQLFSRLRLIYEVIVGHFSDDEELATKFAEVMPFNLFLASIVKYMRTIPDFAERFQSISPFHD